MGTDQYLYSIGVDANLVHRRAVYQWNIPSTTIPEGSTINSVQVSFNYSNQIGSAGISVEFFSVGRDINSPNYDTLWKYTDPSTQPGIGTAPSSSSGTVSASYGSTSSFATAFANALYQHVFVLGVAWEYESPNAGSAEWFVGPIITLVVNYTPPENNVAVDQKLTNGTSFDSVAHYEGASFVNYAVPKTYTFPRYSTQYFRADTNVIYQSNIYQKYNNWNNDNTNVLNYSGFEIFSNTNSIYSQLDTISNATIENVIDGSIYTGSTIQFTDPWLRDNSDALGLRNRGTNAIAHTQNSPFTPNTNTSYKGVFLNQDYNTKPDYYSVSFPSNQSISIGGTNHALIFQNWSANPSGSATFQNANSASTPVVFNRANATVQANVKAVHLSSDANVFSNNSQRRLIETQSGGALPGFTRFIQVGGMFGLNIAATTAVLGYSGITDSLWTAQPAARILPSLLLLTPPIIIISVWYGSSRLVHTMQFAERCLINI